MPRGASGIEMRMGSDILHDNSESYVNSVHARRIIMHCAMVYMTWYLYVVSAIMVLNKVIKCYGSRINATTRRSIGGKM